MVFRERLSQVTLVVLTLPGALLAGQSQKAPESPSSLQHVKSLPWESTGAKKSQTSIGQKDVPAGCPLSGKIAADEGLSHKGGSVFQNLSPQKLFSCLSWSVMVVESLDAKGSVIALGSGVVIGSDHVITNRHVIENGASFRVEHGGKQWPAEVIHVDPDHDLAELSVPELPANAAPVVTRDSSTLEVGEKVFAIGAPEGLELTISEGLISGLRDFGNDKVIQTSAAISPGSSGGGIFDAQGRLVGITTFYLKEGQSLNFALPAEWILALDRRPTKPPRVIDKNSPAFQAMVWFVLGLTASQDGKYSSAVSAYRKALALSPESFEGWFLLGEAYFDLQQLENAVDAYQRSIRLKPDEESTWVRLGNAYGLLGESQKYLGAEQEAIRLNPSDGVAWRNLSSAYGDLGQHEKEIRAAQEAVRLEPDAPGAWFVLGLALHDNDDQSGVIEVYKKLKALDPKLAEKFFQMVVLP